MVMRVSCPLAAKGSGRRHKKSRMQKVRTFMDLSHQVTADLLSTNRGHNLSAERHFFEHSVRCSACNLRSANHIEAGMRQGGAQLYSCPARGRLSSSRAS